MFFLPQSYTARRLKKAINIDMELCSRPAAQVGLFTKRHYIGQIRGMHVWIQSSMCTEKWD
jgi:hypothetical protein